MRFWVLILLFVCSIPAEAQTNTYPLNYFRYPLDLNPALAGAFGDLRPNHFHSGLDFRTNQREGYPVYAVADGYISRLRVQIGGFGQALYVDHPNGFTSVYAHLKAFNPGIASTVKDFQYRLKSFEIDMPLTFTEIPVKKGQVIGWSGNTGSSGGPHLHFEIRDTKTEEIINPQLFGLGVTDNLPPEISGIYLYSLNGEAFNEQSPKQYFGVKGSKGNYQLIEPKTIFLNGESAFGIVALDKNSISGTNHGLYQITLSLDQKPIYTATWNRFSFDDTKAINTHLDFAALNRSGSRIHKSFIEPGNPIKIYQSINNGLITLSDDAIHQLSYTISDVKGNTSSLTFQIKRNPNPTPARSSKKDFVFNQDNQFSNPQVKINIPVGALYSSLQFDYAQLARLPGTYSAQHRIHRPTTPIHKGYQLAIKTEGLPEKLQSKAVIVDSKRQSQGGTYENGFIKAEVKAFGTFFILADTLAPKTTPVNINPDKTMTGISKMLFKIADNLSGINNFIGKIDGQWVLMEYDQKTGTLWHQFDERTKTGKHQFELIVSDKRDNTSIYKANFTR